MMNFNKKFLLIVSIFIFSNIVTESAIEIGGLKYPGEPSKKSYTVNESYKQKADEIITSFVGEKYFKQYFVYKEAHEQYDIYNIRYLYNHPALLENSRENSTARNPSIIFEPDGKLRGYTLPKKPLTFSITKKEAIEIAKKQGIKEITRIDIDYTRQECLPKKGFEEICYPIPIDTWSWIVYHPKHGVPILYIDTENGTIIHSRIDEFPDLTEQNIVTKILDLIKKFLKIR